MIPAASQLQRAVTAKATPLHVTPRHDFLSHSPTCLLAPRRPHAGHLHRRNEPRSGRLHLMSPADGWRDQVLGRQWLRHGRGRDQRPNQIPRCRVRDLDGDEHLCGPPTHVRPADGRRIQVLGQELQRPARGRDHHRPQHPCRRVRDLDGDEPRPWQAVHLRPADGRRDQMLGHQLARPARGRDHHVP